MIETSPLGVLSDDGDKEQCWGRSANHYGDYSLEILAHAGVPHQSLERTALLNGTPLPRIILLPYPLRLSDAEETALRNHVTAGGALIASGGVEGGEGLFGVERSRRYFYEARLHWPAGALGLEEGELPVWGAQLTRPALAEPGEAFGEIRGSDGSSGSGAVLRRLGAGTVCLLSFDVARSVVTAQQGRPVLGDGRPAPDGSAPIDDGILKSDDGSVIDWDLREESSEGPVFATPFADRLRDLLLAAIFTCAERLGSPLPVLWYWPDALPAVATLSFDTDSNEGPDGWKFLEVLERLEVLGTWCVMYPGGYPRELYDAIAERGHEIALHFDGLTSDLRSAPHCSWSEEDFRHQFEWLLAETGTRSITSQKNHVTRWEGWVELFRWVERAGIAIDQTKGPSKIGNMGFTFGTCHPWRPMDDVRNGNRIMNLFELPYITHDMHHSGKRVELRRLLLERARKHAGVAHFVFHPQRIHEEGMPDSLADIVGYAGERGVPWWTSEQIATWERERRAARLSVHGGPAGEFEIELAEMPQGATVLLFGTPDDLRADIPGERVEVFGRDALRLIVPAGSSRIRLARPTGTEAS